MKEELPESVLEALGELAGTAREGLHALATGLGLGVVNELMELEVADVCGPKGKHDPKRKATRWSTERGSVTLGGRRMPIERPRMRGAGGEVPLRTYAHFSSRDPLTDLVFERIMAGVSCRGYGRTTEPVWPRGGGGVEIDLEVGDLARLRRAHPHRARRADEPLPR